MNIHSASYNFPPDFLWGIVPYDGFVSDKDNFPYIFAMQEKNIKAVSVNISRALCEPLKGQYNEEYIETIRTLLIRISGRNISPVCILNTNDAPAWQNLDHPGSDDRDAEYKFMAHVAEVISPYTKFFGLLCPRGSIFSRSRLTTGVELITNICGYIHSLSDTAKTILVIDPQLSMKDEWLDHIRYRFIKDLPVDYLGLEADESTFKAVCAIQGDDHKPVMILSDGLNREIPEKRSGVLADKLYSSWRFYQTGWPLLGFFSETDITKESNELKLYANSSSNNAFAISNDMPYLPVKWQEFLED